MKIFDEMERQKTDMLWKISWCLPKQRPNYSGFMHLLHSNQEHPGKSNIIYLPMIDLNPSDISCIFSTLKYLLMFAQNNNVQPIITFDQPLFWKASTIIQASSIGDELREIVLMLGMDQALHTFMNLLGTSGTLMSGSGFSNILQQVFAENAVVHVPSGKAVSRAFRGHLIIDTCLNSI